MSALVFLFSASSMATVEKSNAVIVDSLLRQPNTITTSSESHLDASKILFFLSANPKTRAPLDASLEAIWSSA